MADKSSEPLPLTAPDGEVIAYACPHCRQVRMSGSTLGPPDSETRRGLAESSRVNAVWCCRCHQCETVLTERTYGLCVACDAKEKPARDAQREEQEQAESTSAAEWTYRMTRVLKNWANDWPLTLVGARDGLGYAAFPLDRDEVPSEINERIEASEWLGVHGSDLFGLASTPEAAIEDLRTKARRVT